MSNSKNTNYINPWSQSYESRRICFQGWRIGTVNVFTAELVWKWNELQHVTVPASTQEARESVWNGGGGVHSRRGEARNVTLRKHNNFCTVCRGVAKWDKAYEIKEQEDAAETETSVMSYYWLGSRLRELYYICQSTYSDERNVRTERVAAGYKWYKSEWQQISLTGALKSVRCGLLKVQSREMWLHRLTDTMWAKKT